MGITDDFCFSYSAQCLSAPRPAHRGRLRRRARVGAGCGVLRAWLVTTPPGGARQNRPSATTSGTRECANARSKGTAHVQRPTISPRWARSQQPPRWSAERRASRVMGCRRTQRLRAYVIGPPTGAAAPERLSALRSLTMCGEGNQQTSESICLARRLMHVQFQRCRTPLRNKSENGFIAFTSPGHDP